MASEGRQRETVEAFLAGRLPYAKLVATLRADIGADAASRAGLHDLLGEYSAHGRLPGDLLALILQEIDQAPGAAGSAVAADADADGDEAPMEDDEATIRQDRSSSFVRSQIDDRVDDVVLQALVEEYKALKQTDPAASPTKADPDLDHFMSAFVGARLRRTAEDTATGNQTGGTARPSPSTEQGRATVGSLLKNRFVLDREIGGGAMGRVYAAVDRRRLEAGDGRPYVAIKVLDRQFGRDSRAFRTFEAEARKAQMLAHPNIVQVFDFDRDGADAFIVMELLRGQALDELLLRRNKALPFAEVRRLMEGAFTGLAFAHARGVLHCDIKPSNIFLTEEGATKLVDFGIASASTLPVFDVDELGSFTGRYAAPEVIDEQRRTPAADVYSLACVVYELLANAAPFGERSSLEAYHHGLKAPRIAGLARQPMRAILDALSFDPDRRIATVEAFRDRLYGSERRWFALR